MVLLSVSLQPGSVIAWILVGLIAGAIAGRITRGKGFGCLGDIVVGLIGALIGGFVVNLFIRGSTTTHFLGTTVVAILGAVILLVGLRLLRGRS